MMKIVSALFLGLLLLGGPALGQGAPQTVKMCIPSSGTSCPVVNASNPLPIVGSFSATLSGFTPNGNYGALTATAASSASTAMPAGTSVAFQNTSTVDVSCVLSAGAATATTNKIIVRGGATVFLTVGSNVNAACINQTGSASNVIVMAGGSGLGTNFGGGGGGGGGGGAVTVADGADVTQGALADAAATAGGTGSLSAKMRLMTTQLNTINTTLGTPFQAGGSIGNTSFGATQSGTWNITNITGTVSLPTGAATSALQTAAAAAKGEGATGSAVPSGAQYLGLNIGGNLTGATGLATGATVKALTVAIVDASGNQVTSFGGSGGTASNFGSAFPSTGTAIGFTDGTNMVAGRVTTWGTTPTGFNALAVNANVLASALPTGAATSANQSSQLTQETATATALGAPADAVCGTATGTCSVTALIKYLNTSANSSTPAGTNVIGKVGIDQTTDGTTNLVALGAQAGSSGATTRMITCDSTAIYDASTSGSTQLVALSSGKTIYVCGYSIMGGGTVNVKLQYGTGSACATGTTAMTPAFQLTAQAGIVDKSPFFSGLKTAASNALCINASGAVAAQAIVYYAQF